MPGRPSDATRALAEAGRALFGEEWAAPLARFTGANERTVRRVRQAARDGREYPAAAGLLAALADRLGAFSAQLKPWARKAP